MDLAGVVRHEPVAVDADRRAAVIIPVILRGERPRILFTKHASHLGEYPGQMSFPGDSREPSDADLQVITPRGSNEEIGLWLEEAAFHGHLGGIWTAADYAASLFVVTVPDHAYEPDQREVAKIAVLAVGDLIDRTDYESERRDHPQHGRIQLCFSRADGYTVRGATGQVLVQLLEPTTDWHVPGEVNRVVDPDVDHPV